MFLVHPLDVSIEIQCFLIVAISNTSLHHLRDLQDLQQLSVFGQCQGVQLPTVCLCVCVCVCVCVCGGYLQMNTHSELMSWDSLANFLQAVTKFGIFSSS